MSPYRSVLVALATMFTAASGSAFAGCCGGWEAPAPVVYSSGCGGCGAAVTYVQPVVEPVAPVVYGCGGCATPVYAQPVEPAPIYVGTGCGGCGRSVVYTAPAPVYMVNQGPEYSGPGLIVPYRAYNPVDAYMPATNFPYVGGYGHWGYRHHWHHYAHHGYMYGHHHY